MGEKKKGNKLNSHVYEKKFKKKYISCMQIGSNHPSPQEPVPLQ